MLSCRYMKNFKEYFKGKKVTCMGLGLLGGMLNDALFLLECGAELTITDLKSAQELASSIKKLSKFKNIKYVLGEHRLEDFKDRDFILQPGNVPPNSPYLLEAQKNNIPIHESESLFFQYASDIKTIGITGTRGKTTTTHLIYNILKSVYDKKVHLAGNIQGRSTLALLKFIKPGDLVVLELDSWCLHGMGDIHKSPNVSVFTNLMPDHLNFYLKNSKDEREAMEKYFTDKAQIYLNQNKEDFLICGEKISKRIGKTKSQPSQIKNKFDGPRKIIAKKVDVPKSWKLKIKGEHNLENIACAIKACEALNISAKSIKKGVENFTGVEGRLEFVKNYKGIKIYNDTTATTPDATIMALRALADKKSKIVLICGGADKGLDMSGLVKEILKYSKSVILLSGSGSLKLKQDFPKQTKEMPLVDNLKEAVLQVIKLCQKGDTLLFSPAFASFGMFKNEYDRGDQFMKLIKALK